MLLVVSYWLLVVVTRNQELNEKQSFYLKKTIPLITFLYYEKQKPTNNLLSLIRMRKYLYLIKDQLFYNFLPLYFLYPFCAALSTGYSLTAAPPLGLSPNLMSCEELTRKYEHFTCVFVFTASPPSV